MFFHLGQVNQMHFRDQHLELSDSPTNEEAYNYFKSIELLWFSRFFTSYFPLWFHRREIMFLFYRPLFHRSLIYLPSLLKISINLMPYSLYFQGNYHIFFENMLTESVQNAFTFSLSVFEEVFDQFLSEIISTF